MFGWIRIALLAFACTTAWADEEIFVVTTIPDLADMAKAVGGDLVKVKSIAKGTEDMHMIPVKPSYLLLLNRADVLIELGLDNEHAWLPGLLYSCRNDKIQPGAPGFVNCSDGILVLEKPGQVDRSKGEIHPWGNPHYNLDPTNGRQMVITVCKGLCRAYPDHAARFRANMKAYLERLDVKLKEWEAMAEPLRGARVVTYHRSWSYLIRHYGMEVVGEIEPYPGIPPTPGHLAQLIRKIEREGADVIIRAPYFSDRYPELIRRKTGVPVVVLPNMSGGTEETDTYIRFIEHNLKTLVDALEKN
jgi:ABC-type Zn uptake system ZnuABC Zn-binding protein ZnuA